MAQAYAGDITSREAWRVLKGDQTAVLVDVRTQPEWAFVGLPDLSEIGRRPICVEWQSYPDMAVNSGFVSVIETAGVGKDVTVLLLCRSGARSRNAAIALTEAGFQRCFNVADGFEGPLDSGGHRSTQVGWKASGLAWKQG